MCFFELNRRQRSNVIHPDNQQDVELLRQRNQDHDDTTTSRSTRSGRSRNDMCPICLTEPAILTVETNCGHVFCGLSFWISFFKFHMAVFVFLKVNALFHIGNFNRIGPVD